MFGRRDSTAIDTLIERCVSDMESHNTDSEEYQNLLTRLERLSKLKQKREPINYDTLITVAGHLAGVLLIIMYEQKHVMTSKAFTPPWRLQR